jgi:hypothetical protein
MCECWLLDCTAITKPELGGFDRYCRWATNLPMKMTITTFGPKIYLIVLTATVTPSINVQVLRNDPEQRKRDYIRAFRFWLRHQDPRLTRLLFIENSGANLDIFRMIVSEENLMGKEVEILSVPPRKIPQNMHYGWGELMMLDDGLKSSSLARSCSHFIKATGRLTFPTISNLLDKAPQDFDALVECRIPTRVYRRGRNFVQALTRRDGAYASTQLLLLKKSFYEQYFVGLAGLLQPFTDSDLMEAVLYKKLLSLRDTYSIHLRFPVNCDPSGVGASHGHDYDSRSRKIVGLVRRLLRGTGLWI